MMNLDLSFYNWDVISNFVVKGFYFSVTLTVVATIGGVIFGTLLALMRLSGKKWLDAPAALYVNGMRSIPLVMVILWFFLLVPASFYSLFGSVGSNYRSEISAVITFVAFEAAYFSEIMRAGIQSIPRGQVNAGQAVGMTYGQNMRLVVLPQAFRNMLPCCSRRPSSCSRIRRWSTPSAPTTCSRASRLPARTSAARSRPTCSRPSSTSSCATPFLGWSSACTRRSPSSADSLSG